MARQHSHKFTIADDDAVRTLVDKIVSVGPQQKVRREKLLRALDVEGLLKETKKRARMAVNLQPSSGACVPSENLA